MSTTNQKGAVAETAIAHEAIELGIEVYRPVAEGGRFDLIFAFEDASLARVQCKWAPIIRGVVTIRACSARRAADGLRQTISRGSARSISVSDLLPTTRHTG